MVFHGCNATTSLLHNLVLHPKYQINACSANYNVWSDYDLNQKAAFFHVVADAVTSVLAIIALFAGKYFGWDFLDAVLGIVGALLVAQWSWGLIRETGKTLLDAEMEHPVVKEIQEVIEELDSQITITDLHVWKVGKGKFSCILSLELHNVNLTADDVRKALSIHEEIVHVSVEVNYKSHLLAAV